MRCNVPCNSSKRGVYGIVYIQAIDIRDPKTAKDLPNREFTLQPKMPQLTDLTEMPSHLRDDGDSDSPVSLLRAGETSRLKVEAL